MENILEVVNISKTYPKSKFALRDISFNVPQGAIMGIVGENGSGKTTTLSIVLGLLRPDTGKVVLFGKPFSPDDVKAKEKIGVVFDTNCFPPSFTPRDISKIYRRIYRNWDEKYFFELLEKYEIEPKQKVGKMSHGTKSMLAIITALSHKPELLILDEPTSGVDPVRREEVLDIFLDFISDGKKSIVFSSHITSDLEKIADYIAFIHKGELLDTVEKDVYLYQYGIIRCNQECFDELSQNYKQEILRYVKRDYQYRILVKDQTKIPSGKFVLENPTLEEIMYLMSRGDTL